MFYPSSQAPQRQSERPEITGSGSATSKDDRLAAGYRQLLVRRLRQSPDAADRHARAAAAALYQAGLHRHKLLLLQNVIERFEARRTTDDPSLAFGGELARRVHDPALATSAARHYRIAIALAPEFAEALYALAVLHRQRGAVSEAAALFHRAATAELWPGG